MHSVSRRGCEGVGETTSLDRIYQVYGENATVTIIINTMKQEQQAGIVHQLLQV
jgi:hypothetical protein